MSKNSSSESSPVMKHPESNKNEGPKTRALSQEKLDEQIQSFIVPLRRQIEDLTPLKEWQLLRFRNFTQEQEPALVAVHSDTSPTCLHDQY